MEGLVVGLDIGTTKVCALVAERDEWGHVNILGLGRAPSTGITRGVVTNIEQTVQAIRQAIQEAERAAGVEVRALYVGVAGEHISSSETRSIVTTRDGEIRQRDVERLLEDARRLLLPADRQILHLMPQEFIVDNHVVVQNPVGMAGIRLEGRFHVVTGLVTAVRNLQRCVERAGYEVADIVLQPLASSLAVLDPEERRAGVALVDIGGGTTDVAVFENNVIRYTAAIPFAGDSVTEDIRKVLHLLPEQAETLKIQYGCAMVDWVRDATQISIPGIGGRPPRTIQRSALAQVIQPRMEEIFELVYEQLRRSGYLRHLSAGVVLTGGGALLAGITELAQHKLGLEARVGLPVGVHGGMAQEVRSPMYATGVGLIHYALSQLPEGKGSPMRDQGRGLWRRFVERIGRWLEEL
ncbi:MAG: cell division protein FtsA [Bacteroidetes bacterium]|nr:cell division protein FtsA [Rhodothermia bacterium]MCS7155872.1 cell division protein FtsA [Bacteroidota bacterium]MCX7906027.1 cell division protein FtsA [Bacteroidota bacterium]MDW8138155.1 cell division protein FtsA [Bacteroidota bacterium]MDW8285839.1 cell division protein FtsA [Bacteroidota bacterium]